MKHVLQIISELTKHPKLVDAALFAAREVDRDTARSALQRAGIELPTLHNVRDYLFLSRTIMALCMSESSRRKYLPMVFVAIKACTSAIKLDPTNIDLYEERGMNCGLVGEHELALADFSKMIHLRPKNANAYNLRGRAHYNLGNLASMWSDFRTAADLGDKKGLDWAKKSAADSVE